MFDQVLADLMVGNKVWAEWVTFFLIWSLYNIAQHTAQYRGAAH